MGETVQALLLPVCVAVFFGSLALRWKCQPADKRQRSMKERVKLAQILAAALLALMAVGYRLQRVSHEMDGRGAHEAGVAERAVLWLAK